MIVQNALMVIFFKILHATHHVLMDIIQITLQALVIYALPAKVAY